MSREPGRHLALVGPTASGKTDVGLALALMRSEAGLATEIVSCDSMQVYRGMDVGTAKPTAAQQAMVRHHMVDVVDPTDDYSLTMFLDSARAALDDIESRGASALLLGGTGLYAQALVDEFDPPPQFPEVAARLDTEPDTTKLQEQLRDLDPVALERIPQGARRRIIRALEVTIGSGKPFSAHGERLDTYSPTPFVLTGLRPDREELTRRINDRYAVQMDSGFLEEARALHGLGGSLSRTAAAALGYRELFGHLRGDMTEQVALESARVRTRRFAVRQLRWFGRDPRITWFDPPGPGDASEPSVVAERIDSLWRKRSAERRGSVATVAGEPGSTAAKEEA